MRLIVLGGLLASGLFLAACKTSGPDTVDKERLEKKAPAPEGVPDPTEMDLTRPPSHDPSMREKVEVRSTATTPTPTPDTPIYRPLDPAGHP